jgi:hypothetical protein
MLGAMKSHLLKLVVLCCVVALAACAKTRTRRAEVVECSSISLDDKGTTLCLVQLYHWRLPAAQKAATARAHETDSIKTWQEDSVWGLSAPKHKSDLQSCRRMSEQINNCLLIAGWPIRRVKRTTDSIWTAELPKHRHELQLCMAKRDFNLSSCLTLYYKWDSDRALATADSVTRARLGRR